MTGTAVRAAPTVEPGADLAAALQAARALERWGSARDWVGPDPYDALNARRLPRVIRRSPLALRVATQAVKRSPLNLRPILGIPDGLSAATLAQVISAYARNGFIDASEADTKLRHCLDRLTALRCTAFPEPCWGYHFDVQTRVFFYPRASPNTIATAFAGLALLDAYELAGEVRALELARGVADFFVRRVPQTEGGTGSYFGYLPGDTTPIHNANMLVCALLARLAVTLEDEDLAARSREGTAWTVACQRPDGSWPYGEQPHLNWVDGFHTGYVLDCLLDTIESGLTEPDAAAAWERGLQYYVGNLIDDDGAARYTPGSRYPIDGQCVAQAIQSLSRASKRMPALGERRFDVLASGLRQLRLSQGAFAFQRERLWVNRATHPRWVEAPMLTALTHLIATV